MKKINLGYIRSFDEEWVENFLHRVIEELKPMIEDVETCNDEIEIEVNLIKFDTGSSQ